MTNINNQSQVLDKIAGLEDLDHENAAVCSGGIAILYDRRNFSGDSRILFGGSSGTLGNFNNKAASIEIFSGLWKFWTRKNFSGSNVTLGVGAYRLEGSLNTFNDNIESYLRIA